MSGKTKQKSSSYKRSNPLIIKKYKRKGRPFPRYDLSVSNVSIHIENKKRNSLFRNVLIYEMNPLF